MARMSRAARKAGIGAGVNGDHLVPGDEAILERAARHPMGQPVLAGLAAVTAARAEVEQATQARDMIAAQQQAAQQQAAALSGQSGWLARRAARKQVEEQTRREMRAQSAAALGGALGGALIAGPIGAVVGAYSTPPAQITTYADAEQNALAMVQASVQALWAAEQALSAAQARLAAAEASLAQALWAVSQPMPYGGPVVTPWA